MTHRRVAIVALTLALVALGYASDRLMPSGKSNVNGSGKDETVRQLIQQLGSERFSERQAAFKSLRAIGPGALRQLREAATTTSDAEIRRATNELITLLERTRFRRVEGPPMAGVRLFPAAVSADGRTVASANASDADNHILLVWRMADGVELIKLRGHKSYVWKAAFSRNGTRLLSSGAEKEAFLWDTSTGDTLAKFRGHANSITGVVCSPDETQVLSCSNDKTARLWNLETGQESMRFVGHQGFVGNVAFIDGDTAVSSSADGTVRLWSTRTAAETRRLTHPRPVVSLAVSSDKRHLASSSGRQMKLVEDIVGIECRIHVWDWQTGKEVRTFGDEKEYVSSLVFSPDGRYLLSGSPDQMVRLWEVATGKEIANFVTTDRVVFVAFSSNGREAFCGSLDNAVYVWTLPISDSPAGR